MSDRTGTSLILGNGEQLTLMAEETLDAMGLPAGAYLDAEARGRFTGERLFSQNPKLYGAIARLVARRETCREIADICQVSLNTVLGVAKREGVPIESIRETIGREAMDVASLAIGEIRERFLDPAERAKMTIKDLSILFGISSEKAQLYLGGATARIETREVSAPGHDDYQRLLDEAQAAVRRGEVNVTPTGLDAENLAPKEAAATALPAPAVGVEIVVQAEPSPAANQSPRDS